MGVKGLTTKGNKKYFYPLTLKIDWQFTSLYNVTPKSSITVTWIKEVIINLRSSWLLKQILLSSSLEKFLENSMEKMQTDVKV